MAYGCLKLHKELPDPLKDCKDCKSFTKKHWGHEQFLSGPDGGPYTNCVHIQAKYRPRKIRR